MDAGSPGCKPVPREAESCKGRGVVRVEESIEARGNLGVRGHTAGESDNSDPEEIGRIEG